MSSQDYELLSNEEKEELLKDETDDMERMKIIRSFSSDDLMMKYVNTLIDESSKAAVTYSLSELENKIKVIESLTDAKWITVAVLELPSNESKIKLLKKVQNSYYRNRIIQSLDNNEEEIINVLDDVENEKDKAIIISRLTNQETKKRYLDKIEDDLNKSIIIMSLEDENLKLEYINKIEDESRRTLLIATLKDRNLRNELLLTQKNTYTNFNLPDGMTIGMEIESEGDKSVDAYLINNTLKGWVAKSDASLNDGVEITSPILTNSKEDTEDIYCVCKILNELGQTTSERCGGHIHIGADYLKSKEEFKNLIELWSNNEELIYLISNKNGEIPRDGAIEYATPISKRIENAIEANEFDDYEKFTKEEFINKIKEVQENNRGRDGRRTGINFLKIDSNDINTIEFRLANGTIDANTWVENANLFGGIVAVSQKISQIQQKEDKDITDEEKRILECFSQLKSSDLSQEERLTLFLELCVPKDMRQLYVDRYNENNAIYNKKFTKKEELEDKISNRPVVFPIGTHLETSLRNIAITERLSSIQTSTAEIRNGHTVEETENSLTN